VHTNQPVYSNGETIWYKVYTMAYGKPSALSKIIYLQLSDTTGNIITQNKLPLIDGAAHGNIDIGQKIKSAWYELSAFTARKMNFGPQVYFHTSNSSDSVKFSKTSVCINSYTRANASLYCSSVLIGFNITYSIILFMSSKPQKYTKI
jgi:hypothetical protein